MEDVAVFPEKGRTQALVMSNCSSIKSIKVFPCKQGFLFYELLDREKRMELVKWKGTPLGGMLRMLCCFFSLVLRASNSFKDVYAGETIASFAADGKACLSPFLQTALQ